MRKNKTFRMIKKLFFNKYTIIVNMATTISILMVVFFNEFLFTNQNISYMYIINFIIYTKRYLILFLPTIVIVLFILLLVLEKRYFKKVFKKYFLLLFTVNLFIAGFADIKITDFIYSLANEYFVQVSDIECTESQDNVECGDYYFAFDRPLDIKDAKSVQAFFERG